MINNAADRKFSYAPKYMCAKFQNSTTKWSESMFLNPYAIHYVKWDKATDVIIDI